MDFDRTLRLFRALHDHDVDYVLVGGVALGVHGLLRTTEDIDLFVRPSAENVERLKRALRGVWDDPDIDQITERDLSGEYPTVRFAPHDGGEVVDLIARLGEAFAYDDVEWQVIQLEGVPVRVATPRMLYLLMKRDTVRPIDRADAEALRERFGLQDV